MKRSSSLFNPLKIIFLRYFFKTISYETLLVEINSHAIRNEVGITINPETATDNVTDVDIAASKKVSIDFNIVKKKRFVFYICFFKLLFSYLK